MQTQLRRFPRLLVGLVVFGFGAGLTILGDYGLPGWGILHQGLSEQLPISIGIAAISTEACILLVVLALREPIGSGTVANVLVIGLAIDATYPLTTRPRRRARAPRGARVPLQR